MSERELPHCLGYQINIDSGSYTFCVGPKLRRSTAQGITRITSIYQILLLPYFKIFVCSAKERKVSVEQKVTERAAALKKKTRQSQRIANGKEIEKEMAEKAASRNSNFRRRNRKEFN